MVLDLYCKYILMGDQGKDETWGPCRSENGSGEKGTEKRGLENQDLLY